MKSVPAITVHHGPCLAGMKKHLPDNSVHAIVTDPPYGLSPKSSKKIISDNFFRLFNIMLPNFYERNPQRIKYSDFVRIPVQDVELSRFEHVPCIKPWISVPKSAVDLQGGIEVGEKKIKAGGKLTAGFTTDDVLVNEIHPDGSKHIGNYVLDFGDAVDFSGSDVSGRYFGEFADGCFTMPVSSIVAPCFPSLQTHPTSSFFGKGIREDIRCGDDSGGNAGTAGRVLASGGAEGGLVLCFGNLTNGAQKFNPTITTFDKEAVSKFVCPKIVRTFAAAGELSSKFEPCLVRFVADATNGARSVYSFHLYLPKNLLTNLQKAFDNAKGFMRQKWDHDVPPVATWREAYRVLKPGGYMLVACGTRTQHRMAVNIEDAGFEIGDVITWHYGSGMPHGLDVGKAMEKKGLISENKQGDWAGYNTQLKPATEFWTLARKPLSEKTTVDNLLVHGTGALNIGASRIPYEAGDRLLLGGTYGAGRTSGKGTAIFGSAEGTVAFSLPGGRYPANLVLDDYAAALLDHQAPDCGAAAPVKKTTRGKTKNSYNPFQAQGDDGRSFRADSGGASRFFYVAKPGPKERGAGNDHETVKPVKLMEYLVRLITPTGGTVLDLYAGSGTTGVACDNLGFDCILFEKLKKNVRIIQNRLAENRAGRERLAARKAVRA